MNICTAFVTLYLCPILLICSSDLPWWKHTIIYEVYLRSFKDSNGDGIGDINGVTEKLDHFVDLNIETLWLSPYSKSPMKDMGYDVSDFMDIEPIFGTMKDFKNLVAGIKKRSMKLIMDLVINHTSDQHAWFQKSIDELEPYRNYYIWKDPAGYYDDGRPIPPNNWRSVFGGKSWTWNSNRSQFYYHAFSSAQPDLNFRNPKVIYEMKKIIDFWIKKGVDGFRIDAAPFIMEDKYFRNEQNRKHSLTMNHEDTYRLINKLREFLDIRYNSKATPQTEIIFVAEAVQSLDTSIYYYGKEGFPVTHYPFNFDLLIMPPDPNQGYPVVLNADYIDHHVNNWLKNIPKGEVVNWVTETHDLPRVSERVGQEFKDIFVTLTMMLPGTVSIYYGQEIGMSGMEIYEHEKVDTFGNRDTCRTPMQWSDSYQYAGFTSSKSPWLPINPNFKTVNVETQKKMWRSHYKMFKILSELRQTETIKKGKFVSYKPTYNIFMFTRKLDDSGEFYIIVLNLGRRDSFDLSATLNFVPKNVKVVTTSLNLDITPGTVMPENCHIMRMPDYSSAVLVADATNQSKHDTNNQCEHDADKQSKHDAAVLEKINSFIGRKRPSFSFPNNSLSLNTIPSPTLTNSNNLSNRIPSPPSTPLSRNWSTSLSNLSFNNNGNNVTSNDPPSSNPSMNLISDKDPLSRMQSNIRTRIPFNTNNNTNDTPQTSNNTKINNPLSRFLSLTGSNNTNPSPKVHFDSNLSFNNNGNNNVTSNNPPSNSPSTNSSDKDLLSRMQSNIRTRIPFNINNNDNDTPQTSTTAKMNNPLSRFPSIPTPGSPNSSPPRTTSGILSRFPSNIPPNNSSSILSRTRFSSPTRSRFTPLPSLMRQFTN